MGRPNILTTLALLGTMTGALGLQACGGPPQPDAMDLDGHRTAPLVRSAGAVHVVVILSHECPIANAYAPRLRELATEFAADRVRWFPVHVAADLEPAAARQHAAEYRLPGQVLLDPCHDIARALEARRTPEAFVLADAGSGRFGVAYRGRIDDQWQAIGARAATASQHYLRDAIAAALAGKAIANPVTEAVGCLLPQPRR